MTDDQLILVSAAAGIGFLHTLIGPDHYLPFITLSRARGWSLARTVAVTLASGLGHVAGSVLLGLLGVAFGWALGGLESLESLRGDLAGWMLLGFGFAYMLWGIRQAFRNRPHTHEHTHGDGTVHLHRHTHDGSHGHLHEPAPDGSSRRLAGLTAWSIFIIFVLGPCEPLIPLLIYPAATGHFLGVALVVAVFALTTLGTMTVLVVIGRLGLERLPSGSWQRWSHAVAGAIVAACGLAIQLGL